MLNKNCSIKFPIPVNIDLPVHKISLIIQSVLGGVDLDTEDSKHRQEFTTARAIIFQNVHRLVRCIIDCQIYLEDSVTVRNALMLARSFGAQVWDDSPLHLKQLEGVGLVSVRKLVAAGIKIIDDIESSEAHQIERALSRNPPYGAQLQEKAKAFPKLRIGLKMMGEPVRKFLNLPLISADVKQNVKRGEHVSVKIKAEIGFINERVPENYQKKAVYVCMLAETSDGHVIHFCRIRYAIVVLSLRLSLLTSPVRRSSTRAKKCSLAPIWLAPVNPCGAMSCVTRSVGLMCVDSYFKSANAR